MPKISTEKTADESPLPIEAFHTRARANEGVTLPLQTPDGKATKHWIKIRGVDSDAFKECSAKQNRQLAQAFQKYEETKDEKALFDSREEIMRNIIASLVIAWSFEKPCTLENVTEFLKDAPQIQKEIDTLSAKRSVFFGKGLTNS